MMVHGVNCDRETVLNLTLLMLLMVLMVLMVLIVMM